MAFRPTIVFPVCLTHLLVVRKREALDHYIITTQSKPFLRVSNRRRVSSGKRIQWQKLTAIQQDTELLGAFHKTMKDQTQMPLSFGDSLVDDLGALDGVV
ncbi:hypothetical protein SDC9_125009 [bioreactor metagenome]|uniref:Uncharacterized protein n=1 Tax=bioreactor metagenome TaxID=1076179 RepID=A0A645CM85_9ZZZZ